MVKLDTNVVTAVIEVMYMEPERTQKNSAKNYTRTKQDRISPLHPSIGIIIVVELSQKTGRLRGSYSLAEVLTTAACV